MVGLLVVWIATSQVFISCCIWFHPSIILGSSRRKRRRSSSLSRVCETHQADVDCNGIYCGYQWGNGGEYFRAWDWFSWDWQNPISIWCNRKRQNKRSFASLLLNHIPLDIPFWPWMCKPLSWQWQSDNPNKLLTFCSTRGVEFQGARKGFHKMLQEHYGLRLWCLPLETAIQTRPSQGLQTDCYFGGKRTALTKKIHLHEFDELASTRGKTIQYFGLGMHQKSTRVSGRLDCSKSWFYYRYWWRYICSKDDSILLHLVHSCPI